ncbi:hypothetical protein INR49_019812 [Caranx melampygus]|nr:hypothetical protein INR49_019812 [Caranx melampygus]
MPSVIPPGTWAMTADSRYRRLLFTLGHYKTLHSHMKHQPDPHLPTDNTTHQRTFTPPHK